MSTAQPGNFTITAGKSRTEDFIVYGPGGKNAPGGPDIDLITEVDPTHLVPLGSGGTVTLVPTGDGTASRRVLFTAGGTSGSIFGARVVAHGKAADQYGGVIAGPDDSGIEWVTESLSAEF